MTVSGVTATQEHAVLARCKWRQPARVQGRAGPAGGGGGTSGVAGAGRGASRNLPRFAAHPPPRGSVQDASFLPVVVLSAHEQGDPGWGQATSETPAIDWGSGCEPREVSLLSGLELELKTRVAREAISGAGGDEAAAEADALPRGCTRRTWRPTGAEDTHLVFGTLPAIALRVQFLTGLC